MDPEIYSVILELLAQSHDFGESLAGSVELWISVSFAMIGAAYFAPDRLNVFVATFLIVIYVAFSIHTFGSTDADARASQAALNDAKRIAAQHEIKLDLLDLRGSDDPGSKSGPVLASDIFIWGLFLGVVGFVGITSFKSYRKGPPE